MSNFGRRSSVLDSKSSSVNRMQSNHTHLSRRSLVEMVAGAQENRRRGSEIDENINIDIDNSENLEVSNFEKRKGCGVGKKSLLTRRRIWLASSCFCVLDTVVLIIETLFAATLVPTQQVLIIWDFLLSLAFFLDSYNILVCESVVIYSYNVGKLLHFLLILFCFSLSIWQLVAVQPLVYVSSTLWVACIFRFPRIIRNLDKMFCCGLISQTLDNEELLDLNIIDELLSPKDKVNLFFERLLLLPNIKKKDKYLLKDLMRKVKQQEEEEKNSFLSATVNSDIDLKSLNSDQEGWLSHTARAALANTNLPLSHKRSRRPNPLIREEDENEVNTLDIITTMNLKEDGKEELAVMLQSENLDKIDFDVFRMNQLSKGAPITHLVSFLLYDETYNCLIDIFHLNRVKVQAFLLAVDASYEEGNPYHNRIHAADVLHFIHILMKSGVKDKYMSDMDTLSLIIAGACHDLKHPGFSNNYLIMTKSKLARIYNDNSVLENFHASTCFELLKQPGNEAFDKLDEESQLTFRYRVIELILATDLKEHFSIISSVKQRISAKLFDPTNKAEDRLMITKMLLKCADVSHPCRPALIHQRWTYLIMKEFYFQGDNEKKLRLPVSMFCDRETTDVPKSQIGFISFLVIPAFESIKEFNFDCLNDFVKTQVIPNIEKNNQFWSEMTKESYSAYVSQHRSILYSPKGADSPNEPDKFESTENAEAFDRRRSSRGLTVKDIFARGVENSKSRSPSLAGRTMSSEV